MTTLVRVRHPKGILKIEFPASKITAIRLYESVASELAAVYPEVETFWISLEPQEPEKTRITPSAGVNLSLSHGQLLYLHLKKDSMTNKKVQSSATKSLDAKLEKMDGKITRTRNERLCRHGPIGMCDHCQPLEPYDQNYLEKQGIKHLSFYSYLKKLKDASNAAVPISSLLETPNYTVDTKCPNHPPFPEAICTKCQPSAIILRQQPFRMVDHVEIASPKIVDEFLAGWRSSGFQRFGWLIGKYEAYTDQVPLGIKAVVEYIYEPPQDGSIDGFQLLETEFENGIDPRHFIIFKDLNLEIVGMIYTDLIDDGSGTGKVVERRSKETFFVSSPEILFIAHQQALHPLKLPIDPSKHFSSRFVTVVISGETEGGIGLKAYQVSESAVAMEEAHLIAATMNPSQMLVRSVEDQNDSAENPLYVPQVFYKFKNEYGFEVQKAADPLFPVEYLLVNLSEGIPLHPKPILKAPLSFPCPLLHPSNSNLVDYFKDILNFSPKELAASDFLSNMNLLLFLSQNGLIANESERSFLCQSISSPDPNSLAIFIEQSETWKRIMSAVSEAVAHNLNNAGTSGSGSTWNCLHCTFVNETKGIGEQTCEMCGLPQP